MDPALAEAIRREGASWTEGRLRAFGGILALSGLWLRASRHEKKAGTVGVAAGVLTILAALPVLKVFATPLMLIGGVGLLLVGGWSLYKLARGLRQR